MCMSIEHVRGSRNVSKGVVGPNDNFVCRRGGGGGPRRSVIGNFII